MSDDSFNMDDLSNTFARFTDKRRNIVYDESKLKRKEIEPVKLSSATQVLGSTIFSAISHTHNVYDKKPEREEYKSPIRYHWEKKIWNDESD